MELRPSVGSTQTPKTMSEVEQQFVYVDKTTGSLGELIMRLGEKLLPILRNPNSPVTAEQKEVESLTPLAGQIRKIGKDMNNFAGQIESILERLEL